MNEKYNLELPDFEVKKIPNKMIEFKKVFDLYYDKEKNCWLYWLKTIPPYVVPKDVTYS